jgi:hypothetical protein
LYLRNLPVLAGPFEASSSCLRLARARNREMKTVQMISHLDMGTWMAAEPAATRRKNPAAMENTSRRMIFLRNVQ